MYDLNCQWCLILENDWITPAFWYCCLDRSGMFVWLHAACVVFVWIKEEPYLNCGSEQFKILCLSTKMFLHLKPWRTWLMMTCTRTCMQAEGHYWCIVRSQQVQASVLYNQHLAGQLLENPGMYNWIMIILLHRIDAKKISLIFYPASANIVKLKISYILNFDYLNLDCHRFIPPVLIYCL